MHTCETQVQEKRDGPPWFEKNAVENKKCDNKKNAINDFAKLRQFSVKSGHHGFGELVLGKQTVERRVLEILGPWPQMLEMLLLKWLKHMSEKFCDIPANFGDMFFECFVGILQKYVANLFSTRLESLVQTY